MAKGTIVISLLRKEGSFLLKYFGSEIAKTLTILKRKFTTYRCDPKLRYVAMDRLINKKLYILALV